MIGWLRHGESTWNAAGRLQFGDRTPPLTRVGRAQARAAAEALRGAPYRVLLTSPAVRAVQTAEIVSSALGLTPVLDARLVERGRQETVDEVRIRILAVLRAHGDDLLLVTHGDTIAIAVELLTGRPCPVPGNADLISTAPTGLNGGAASLDLPC
ncbi:hypothetical protein AFL01nite_03110 [Aeromicrobium flavum]|uniref:Phosphoglycerate mutase n=1 Tax=Aeromicrobium flavum TaxID=416568 RepID=A0A512HRA2_9ACTN|nr:histidine phosphatase family protein [Aeromicrobium flavum]GEO87984.1 hypothetical protein AFL01nite_03110 [Aeromicrobium flavum]